MSALAGVTVVELASESTAFAGKLMGDMGADVILVEPPGGSPLRNYGPFVDDQPGPERSLHWWHYQTSKRGVTIDLEQADGVALLAKLVAQADVLLDAEPVGHLASLGLAYKTMAEANRSLVQTSITAFGQASERSNDPVTDLTILAGGGPLWSCGYSDHDIAPIRGGGGQGFHIACHYAVMATLTALLHCEATGTGQFVDVSQHAAANITTEMASYHWLIQQGTVKRQTGRHASETETSPTQVRCADGRYVNTGVLPRRPREFRGLLNWLEELGVKDDFPEAVFLELGATRDQLSMGQIGKDDEVTAIFAAARDAMAFIATVVDAYDYFVGSQKAGIPSGIVYAPEEAFEDEHFVARGFQHTVAHDDRVVRYPGAPYRFEKTPWAISRRAPQVGEHNDEILDKLATTGLHSPKVDEGLRRQT